MGKFETYSTVGRHFSGFLFLDHGVPTIELVIQRGIRTKYYHSISGVKK